VGEAYDIQIEGKSSLVCGSCGYHFYSSRTPYVISNLPVHNPEALLVR